MFEVPDCLETYRNRTRQVKMSVESIVDIDERHCNSDHVIARAREVNNASIKKKISDNVFRVLMDEAVPYKSLEEFDQSNGTILNNDIHNTYRVFMSPEETEKTNSKYCKYMQEHDIPIEEVDEFGPDQEYSMAFSSLKPRDFVFRPITDDFCLLVRDSLGIYPLDVQENNTITKFNKTVKFLLTYETPDLIVIKGE